MRKDDLAGALSVWEEAHGRVDEYVYWSNLGTLKFAMGQLPEARVAYEKARLHTLYSDSLERQVKVLEERLEIPSPSSSYDATAQAMWGAGPLKIWIGCLLLASLAAFAAFHASTRLARALWGCSVALPLLIALWFQSSTSAVVVDRQIEAFSGPSAVFHGGAIIPAGSKVWLWDAGGWWRVVGPGWARGWLTKDQLSSAFWLWGGPK